MSKSYHIFYFPFIVKHNEKDDFIIKALNTSNSWNLWKRKIQNKEELHDEKMYYHHFVHNALYDNGNNLFYKNNNKKKNKSQSNHSLVLHYERTDIISKTTQFKIKVNNKCMFNLDVEKITLDYYFMNVGILTLHVANDKKLLPQDILDINYYGRTLYGFEFEGDIDCSINLGHAAVNNKKSNIFNEFSINKKKSQLTEENHLYTLKGHIKQLLDDLFTESTIDVTSIEYLPVFDNKMFVNCIYLNDELSSKYKEKEIDDLTNELFWQNFVEIDHSSDFGCQDKEMRKLITKKNTYLRWHNYGTLYGITDRSFVCVCSDDNFSQNVLLSHIQTIYFQMIKLVLIQRASLLAFSDNISRINFNTNNIDTADKIGRIYRNYIIYIKKLYFKDVTSQIQGVELYEKLHDTFNIKSHIEMFDNELNNTNMYLSALKDSDKRDNQNNLFNLLAGLFLPATLVSGILGMNNILTDNKNEFFSIGHWDVTLYEKRYILHDLAIVLLVSLVFWLIMAVSNKTARSIVRSNKIAFIIVTVLTLTFLIICLFLSMNRCIER